VVAWNAARAANPDKFKRTPEQIAVLKEKLAAARAANPDKFKRTPEQIAAMKEKLAAARAAKAEGTEPNVRPRVRRSVEHARGVTT
jgi:hypothetical protein